MAVTPTTVNQLAKSVTEIGGKTKNIKDAGSKFAQTMQILKSQKEIQKLRPNLVQESVLENIEGKHGTYDLVSLGKSKSGDKTLETYIKQYISGDKDGQTRIYMTDGDSYTKFTPKNNDAVPAKKTPSTTAPKVDVPANNDGDLASSVAKNEEKLALGQEPSKIEEPEVEIPQNNNQPPQTDTNNTYDEKKYNLKHLLGVGAGTGLVGYLMGKSGKKQPQPPAATSLAIPGPIPNAAVGPQQLPV